MNAPPGKSRTKNSNIIVDYSSGERTLKEKAYALFCQNPRIKAKQVCSFYHIPYTEHGQTINNYLSGFRYNPNYGHIPSEPKNSPHCRKWVWNKVVFSDEGRSEALSHGWRLSKNRNRMLVFKDRLGSVQWFESGTVLVLLRGCSRLADAKTLFWRSFSWLGDEECSRLCEGSLREVGRHWVFDVGVELPRFKLPFFRKTHGLTIKSNGSHPGKLEVVETAAPLYLQDFITTQKLLAQNIRSHLELIENWKKESEERAAAHSEDHSKSDEGFWRKFLRVMTTPL